MIDLALLEQKLEKDRRDDQVHVERAMGYVRNFGVAIDGGAHVGVITDMLRPRFIKTIAYEPNPLVFQMLMHRADTERWIGAELREKALGNVHAKVWFGNDGRKVDTRGWFADPARVGDVQMVRLDEDVQGSVDLIKLDLEGGELNALRGAAGIIKLYKPVIVFEANASTFSRSNDMNGALLFGLVREMGYQIAWRNHRDFVAVQ